MLQILFVCTGNTCRSPMAETLLKERIRHLGEMDRIAAFSAGLAAFDGEPASYEACAVMARRGLSLKQHRAQRVSKTLLREADLILTMGESHKRGLLLLSPEMQERVYSLHEYADETGEISDPYGGPEAVYEACAGEIDQLLEKIWHKVVLLAGKKA